MNNKQTDKHSVYFARQWLEELLTMCRRTKGFLYHLRRSGHMSYRKTSFDNTADHLTIEDFLRFMVNMAMVHTAEEFFKYWNILGEMIYEYANEHGDEFNEQYAKHNKPKKPQF